MNFIKGLFWGVGLAAVGLLSFMILSKQGFDWSLIRQFSVVQGLNRLETTQELAQIEGLQLVSEFIFPYDFIPSPYPNWSILALKDPALYNKVEREQRRFFDEVRRCGYDLALRRDEFFLVRVKAGLGYDFLSPDEATHPWVWWNEEAVLSPPVVHLLYFMMDDSLYLQKKPTNSQIDAFTWRCLIEYLEPKLYNKMITDEVKEQAAQNVAQLMHEMLLP